MKFCDIWNNQWTTNYLFEMEKRDLGFDEALSEATLHGYAEQILPLILMDMILQCKLTGI